jgi:cation:H+ antiporter
MVAFLFIAGLGLLFVGGEALVRGAVAVGIRIGMTPMVVGLTIVAGATSAPELAVSLGAALRDVPGLAIGNVVGSNLCNLTLVFGVVALVAPARLSDKIERSDVAVLTIATILVPALLLDGSLARGEGILLVVGIAAFILLTVWRTKTRSNGEKVTSSVPAFSDHPVINSLVGIVGIALLIIGSDWMVQSSIAIATALGVSPAVVGLSASALGTSLPELAASIVAARHRHPELAVGNLIGSNIFNLLLILGATSTVHPLAVNAIGLTDIATMIVASLLCLALILGRKQVGRIDGILLLSIYAGYLIWLFASGADLAPSV